MKYVYIYLNPLIQGEWSYKDQKFLYKPFYVGKGIDKRYRSHLNLNREKYEKNSFKYDILKSIFYSDSKPIVVKMYENLNDEEATVLEIDIISTFGRVIDSSGILSNITIGGDNTCANSLGEDNIHSKTVYQYSLSGELLKVWKCGVREIGRTLNKSYNTIAGCCRGDIKTAYGYHWSYEDKGCTIETITRRSQPSSYRKVYVYDIDDHLLQEVKSVTECSIMYNTTKVLVCQCCRNKGVFGKKYKFRYEKY